MINSQLNEEAFESLLRTAVIEHCYEELERYPSQEELNLIDDSSVDRKIRRLIRSLERKAALKNISRYVTKVAAILLILCGISFIGLLQVGEVRASCINFFKTAYEKFMKYDISNTSPDNDFIVEYVPAGYMLIEEFHDENLNRKIYENDDKNRLTIDFMLMQKVSEHIDNEDCMIEDFLINGNECQSFIYDNEKDNKLIMITESGTFTIKGEIPKAELEEIAKNLK